MAQLVIDCLRCGAKMTSFEVLATHFIRKLYDWKRFYEAFAICRHCDKTTTFVLSQSSTGLPDELARGKVLTTNCSLNDHFNVEGHLSLKDMNRVPPPNHIPPNIKAAFEEGATCIAVGCYNAGGTMFRLCVDHATRGLLPQTDIEGLNPQIRRSLGLRVGWLLKTSRLPANLQELSTCIREDGNDGAHAGTLTETDAEDILDFTVLLLERLYTEPEQLRQAQLRRQARRKTP
jgi:Domain of unknown function (DUF4145)